MPFRTTAAAVNKLREVNTPDGVSLEDVLEPFIETANMLVTDILGSKGLSDAKLELIERWLATHFYAISPDGRMTLSETLGPITETFFGKTGFALNHTPYGQQVMLIDTTGSFAAWNARVIKGVAPKASVTWGGTPRE
jgi:hypothetical protein